MPPFKRGTTEHKVKKGQTPYLRIKAGPQRDKYVHTLIVEAREGRKLEIWETVEHENGNGLDCGESPTFSNLKIVTRPENTRLMYERRKKLYGNRG